MRMDDETLKRILQEGMDYEADLIMDEVNSDPNIQNIEAPEAIYENMWKEIQGYKDAEAQAQEKQAQEEQELIRLGKLYKKKRARNKYIILIAAVVCALGIGTISFGDGKKVFTEMKRVLGDREQTVVNMDGKEGQVVDKLSSEEEAYEHINENFGFWPVRMYYLPEGINYVESNIEAEKQTAHLYYASETGKNISYCIVAKNRSGSVSVDVEDEFIQETSVDIEGVTVTIQKYMVKENNTSRWLVLFNTDNAQYWIVLMGMEEDDVTQIVKNLKFL